MDVNVAGDHQLAQAERDRTAFQTRVELNDVIYIQVDSANADTNYGNILETHENAGGTYNNIFQKTIIDVGDTFTVPEITTPTQNVEGLPVRVRGGEG